MKAPAQACFAITIAFLFSQCTPSKKPESPIPAAAENGVASCVAPISKEDSAKFVSKSLEVKGEVENLLNLNVDSLKLMKTVTIDSFKVVCQSGAIMKEDKSCKGVLLKDILDKAKIKQKNHKDRNFYIVARATDNYKATFSWAELFNNPTGDNTYVLFEENGQPIKKQGELILICKNDIKTGPRHVFWLKSIEVYRVN
jgi:DMSO/TMAO reductase YedYZ molybdopterin-dependent catalytic subunit